MQKKNATVHLLILDPSQNDAESLVSLLRNSGKATRAHRITSEEDLEETLKAGNWDLLLARDLEQRIALIKHQTRKYNADPRTDQQHHAILQAVLARQPTKARAVAQEHVRTFKNLVLHELGEETC